MNVGWKFDQPRRLLAFELGGRGKLPPAAPADESLRILDDPSYRLDAQQVAAGRALYAACAICHGRGLVSAGGPAPDLRASRVALNPESLWTVLHDGALLPKGMPQFQTLTRAQVMEIYSYIRARARAAASH